MNGPFIESVDATPYILAMINQYVNNKNTEALRYTENGLLIRSLGGIYHISVDKIMED